MCEINKKQYSESVGMEGFISGKLKVIEKANKTEIPNPKNKNRTHWKCLCECGKTCIVMGKYLRLYEVKSCGCLNRTPLNPEDKIKHGHAINGNLSQTLRVWYGIRSRCLNPKPDSKAYKDYKGRGITMCQDWIDSFDNFLRDMGEKPKGKSIGRINNDGPYSKENCRWESTIQQAQNTRKTHLITYNNETYCLTEWARKIGISESTLLARLKTWTIEDALTRPKRQKRLV